MVTKNYRPDIDGLRAIAVMSVFLFHAGYPGVTGGFVGVDVFFVISGYLISRQLYDLLAIQKVGVGKFIADFYERRARRILPAFFFTSTVTALAAVFVFTPDRIVEFARSLLYSSLFSGNIFFWMQDSYFSPVAETQPLLHYWSLGVEEHFYLIFPIFVFFAWRLKLHAFCICLIVILCVSASSSEWMLSISPTSAFYLLPFRAWELMIGSMIALPSIRPPSRAVSKYASLLGLVAIVASISIYTKGTPFPGINAALPCIGAALIIWGGLKPNPASSVLGYKPISYVGRLSYSLYLVHWPVIVFAHQIDPEGSMLRQIAVFFLSFALAAISYHLVEKPTRNRHGFWTLKPIVSLSCAGTAIPIAFGFVAIQSAGFNWNGLRVVKELQAFEFDYRPAYHEGTCFLRPEQSYQDITAPCLPTNGKVALIWGDSYAAHYVQALTPELRERGYSVGQITASACLPILGRKVQGRVHCADINDFAMNWIKKNKPSVVILSAFWSQDLTAIAALEQTVSEIRQSKVIFLGESPYYKDTVPHLLIIRRTQGDWSNLSKDDLNPQAFQADQSLKDAFDGKTDFVSILDLFCKSRQCPMTDGKTPFHWDTGHLTKDGADAIVDSIMPTIDKFLVEDRPKAASVAAGR
jgi:peptidoglycan/LPS O-acetylase OafA/YrhL